MSAQVILSNYNRYSSFLCSKPRSPLRETHYSGCLIGRQVKECPYMDAQVVIDPEVGERDRL